MGRESKVRNAVCCERGKLRGRTIVAGTDAALIEEGRTRRRILHRATGSGAHAPQLCPDRHGKVPAVIYAAVDHGRSRGPESMAEECAVARRARVAALKRDT